MGPFLRIFELLFLFQAVLSIFCAQAAENVVSVSVDASISSTSIPTQRPAPQHVAHDQQHGENIAVDGAEIVKDALSILQQLGNPGPHHISRKPSRLLGSVKNLANWFIPRLYISGPPLGSTDHIQPQMKLNDPLLEAAFLLEKAAKLNNSDSIYLLAQMGIYGNFTYPRNYTEAFSRYMELATLDGNSSAQHMVGFMYATGIGGAVERDQAKALLYHTFAAQAGHTKSEMTIAFRHHSGIGVSRNCDAAVHYYKKVADKAIRWYRSGPPGGRAWVQDSYRLADEDGGVYGEGASFSSAGDNAQKGGPNSDVHAALDDVLEYLDLMSGKGDFKATFSLGRIHYDGQRGLTRDMKEARKYFITVAAQYWKAGGGSTVDTSDKPGLEKIACKAAGYLGRMSLRGEGIEQSYKKALKWFQRGLKSGDAGSQYGLGLMYQSGLGVPKNLAKATEYFKAAADQDYPSAQVSLGALYLDQGGPSEIQIANRCFELATRYGHIEAFYYLAEMIDQGIGRDRSCALATAYYKTVAEKAEPLLSSFAEANQAYEEGDYELALVDFMMAAEQGYEKAQANVAYLLDQKRSMLTLPSLLPLRKARQPFFRNAVLALIYWTRSAKQNNIDSMVKMGDYYLYGIGTEPDMEKAATCYAAASEFHQSAQALYNLGWMHENGIGLTQDFHLAKRFYDQALETNEEAYLPVTLSLLKLRFRSAWNTLTRGRVNSIRDEPVPKKQWSFREWVRNFLQDDIHEYNEDYDDDDVLRQSDSMPGGDDDLYDDLVDDGVLESFIILGLAAALIWLIYYRQQRQLAHRREEAERAQQNRLPPLPQPAENRGLFPQVGDPDFQQWVVGGVGH